MGTAVVVAFLLELVVVTFRGKRRGGDEPASDASMSSACVVRRARPALSCRWLLVASPSPGRKVAQGSGS